MQDLLNLIEKVTTAVFLLVVTGVSIAFVIRYMPPVFPWFTMTTSLALLLVLGTVFYRKWKSEG